MDLQPLVDKAQDIVHELQQCGMLITLVLWFLGVLSAINGGLLMALVFRRRSL